MEETVIDVRTERADTGERGILGTRSGAAIVQEFSNVGGAVAHHREPRSCD